MTFGEDLGWGSSVEESRAIIDRFIDLGGNFIDTANFYTKSHSEKIIGDHNAGRIKADRGFITDTFLTGKTYAIVDELEIIAKAHESTVARVALAWVLSLAWQLMRSYTCR
jgi:aryl-alcohol dehydrogenase-like predicted oxidoreductase